MSSPIPSSSEPGISSSPVSTRTEHPHHTPDTATHARPMPPVPRKTLSLSRSLGSIGSFTKDLFSPSHLQLRRRDGAHGDPAAVRQHGMAVERVSELAGCEPVNTLHLPLPIPVVKNLKLDGEPIYVRVRNVSINNANAYTYEPNGIEVDVIRARDSSELFSFGHRHLHTRSNKQWRLFTAFLHMCETELKLQEVNASTTLDKDHTPADSHGVRTRGVNTPGDYERGTKYHLPVAARHHPYPEREPFSSRSLSL
ncbi:hypothetical protein A1Q1_07557 [Trichosporon asahii var. asahii CBS 2479]|uniref:Uncharacterized protein n=1 Tax=Trichosporon asahii var. asahii (strain ATCC 90039 / CBS 2479 / JCM 2466 / KCTC 7840 / NBRC 103889/ NCYC 2677 / UAMH 7654) TaxID=1186058 RepID=J5TJP1_TRIAS|nr:hypothetical protein A1Q1_07557 [Trichosporon asahii var. asahii CBS 2479]EJT51246.1 hypothetical protein A1Q1_07557 [Trichosporon asahii var. asahii CBS 2479]